MASVWGELKRRNVVRVAVAYVIVGWLILQLADVLVPLLTLPEWVERLIFLILLLGLPLALFFAWAYELTPEGLKKEQDVDRSQSITHVTGRRIDFVIIGVLVLALAVFAVERFVLLPDRVQQAEIPREVTETVVQQSIAVLPFVNMSSDPEQEYFSDGLSEEILNLLAKMPELKVIARTSSFAFKGTNEDVRIIGEKLGVAKLLEGSVRKSGDQVRITAQLVNASDGAHVWSDTYTRSMTDVFALQDEIAGAIIDELEVHVANRPNRGQPTENTDAYALYLKARDSINEFEHIGAREALLQAIELDPDFAEAYQLLAVANWWYTLYVPAEEGRKLTHEAAAKALEIDPDLPFAKAMWSDSLEDVSWAQNISNFEQVVRDDPSNTFALDILTYYLQETGYFREALHFAERYVELDPLAGLAHARLSESLTAVGRRDEALTSLEIAAGLGTGYGLGFAIRRYIDVGDDATITEYAAELQRIGIDVTLLEDLLVNAVDPSSGPEYLDRRIPEIVSSVPADHAWNVQRALTSLYLSLGFVDRYYELIFEAGVDSPWTDAETWIAWGTANRQSGFTADPRYLEVAEAYGLTDLWDERGAPDFCTKSGGQWICE